jgi:hypothetical protein
MRRRKSAREKEILLASSGLSVDAGLPPIVETSESPNAGDDASKISGGEVSGTGVELDDASLDRMPSVLPEFTSQISALAVTSKSVEGNAETKEAKRDLPTLRFTPSGALKTIEHTDSTSIAPSVGSEYSQHGEPEFYTV